MRILLIDDNRDAAESLRVLLELEGHETAVAHDGASGLEEARSFVPEAILCDLDMPGELDGYALARAVREEPDLESTLLVALTGYGTEDVAGRMREAGFHGHLMKPVELQAIERVLRDLAGEEA